MRLVLVGLVLVAGCARVSNSQRVDPDSAADAAPPDVSGAEAAIPDAPGADTLVPDALSADSFTAPGLVALYLFDEGSGTVIHDRSGRAPTLDLSIPELTSVSWTSDGLQVTNDTVIQSIQPAAKVADACTQSKALSVEAWVTPATNSQGDNARIVTISIDPYYRNLTLGHSYTKFMARVRTTVTGVNALPDLVGAAQTATNTLTHLVFTHDAAGSDTLYVNGGLYAERSQFGDIASWDTTYHLALANEPDKTRPWFGTYHMLGIYDRALTDGEVLQHYQAGAP